MDYITIFVDCGAETVLHYRPVNTITQGMLKTLPKLLIFVPIYGRNMVKW